MSSLKRFKDDAKEVAAGFECGVGIDQWHDIKVGDQLEVFEYTEVARKLGDSESASKKTSKKEKAKADTSGGADPKAKDASPAASAAKESSDSEA